MDPLMRWEAAAIRNRGGRPRPGTGDPAIDLRGSRSSSPAPEPSPPPATLEPDTLLVPLDAWNRMLNQLGNLHEAGRDLADARERAGRAETEAAFLRERVADLRDQLAAAAEKDAAAELVEHDPVPTLAGRSGTFVRSAYAGWRSRSKRPGRRRRPD